MRYILFLTLAIVLSCKSQKQSTVEDDRLTVLIQDSFFPAENPQSFLIKNEKELTAFFSKINRTRKPRLPRPIIDFSQQVVLVACMGEIKSAALPKMILNDDSEEQLIIEVQMDEMDPKEDLTTFPFCVYSLTNMGKEVLIRWP